MEQVNNTANELSAWHRFLYATFVPRKYERNKFDSTAEKRWFYTGSFVLGVPFVAWVFLPLFKIPFILASFVYVFVCPAYLIKLANQLIVLPVLTILFCALALHFHWQWGLSVFGYHFEKYICYVFLVGAGLALFRRGWNTIAWKVLDKIIQHH